MRKRPLARSARHWWGTERGRWTWALWLEGGVGLGLCRATVIRERVGRERRGRHGLGFSQLHLSRAIAGLEAAAPCDGDERWGGGVVERKRPGDRRGCPGNCEGRTSGGMGDQLSRRASHRLSWHGTKAHTLSSQCPYDTLGNCPICVYLCVINLGSTRARLGEQAVATRTHGNKCYRTSDSWPALASQP